MVNMKQALMYRARLLGEGITGGMSDRGTGLTGGCNGRACRRKTGGRKKGGKKTGAIPKQLSAWMSHVKKVRKAHPNKAYKDVLKMASKSY